MLRPRLILGFTVVGIVLAFRAKFNNSILAFLWILAVGAVYGTSAAGRTEGRGLWENAKQQWRNFADGKSPTPWLATLVSVGVPMALVALLNGRNVATYDNYGIQLTAASLLLHGSAEFSRLTDERTDHGVDCGKFTPYPRVCGPSGLLAATPAGMLLFLLPSYATARMVGADLTNHTVLWRLAKWTAAGIAGACLILFFLLALRIAGLPTAAVGTLFLALGSALWSTIAQGVWAHGGVCFGVLLALWALFIQVPRKPLVGALWIGVGWAVMIASRNSSAPMIILFALWLLPRPKILVPAGIAGAFGFSLLSFYYFRVYGDFLGPQVAAFAGSHASVYSLATFPEGFYGLLLAPGTGLFIYQAWLLFLFVPNRQSPATAAALPAHWKGLVLAMSLSQIFFYSCFRYWDGQWCWGTRYLAESIPLLALAALPGLSVALSSTKGRRLAYALGTTAFLIHLNGTSLAGNQWHFHPRDPKANLEERSLDWRDAAFLYPIPRWIRESR